MTQPPLLPPRHQASGSSDDALRDLRRFHFGSVAERGPDDSAPASDAEHYLPALLHASRHDDGSASEYPVLLPSPETGEQGSCVALPDLLLRTTTEDEPTARQRLEDLARWIRRQTAGHSAPVEVARIFQQTDATEPQAEESERLLPRVPAGASLLPESEQAPLHLLMRAARCRLLPAHIALRDEIGALVAEAQALLTADRRQPESQGSGPIQDSLGKLGARFVDPSALAGVLDERGGGTALAPERRESLEKALATLEAYLAAESIPAPILVHDGEHGIPDVDTLGADPTPDLDAWQITRHMDPCAAATEIFDQQAEAMARVLRAVRRVRLEAGGRFDPERQDPWLARFDWQAFSRQELSLLTPVVALVSAERVAKTQMASLSALLRSGRPVQILVPLSPAVDPGAPESLAGFRFEPAYLGLAHREALVQQASTARPVHLFRGFARALAATHAGLHVIAPANDPDHHAAALEGRAHPLFLYDPEDGSNWAERFDFSSNPQPSVDWPTYSLETRRPDGSREPLELAFTFADFALLTPAFRRHFQVISDGVPESELVPIAEYSSTPPDDGSAAIPYLWTVDGSEKLLRLAVSRPLALACRDRLDFWRTLQELSGVRSEHVRRARERLREELEHRAARAQATLEARHADELERVRREAARDVVDRLTAALFEVDLGTFTPTRATAASLASLASEDVDSVEAALLEIVDPASLDEEPVRPHLPEKVEKIATQLLQWAESTGD